MKASLPQFSAASTFVPIVVAVVIAVPRPYPDASRSNVETMRFYAVRMAATSGLPDCLRRVEGAGETLRELAYLPFLLGESKT
jgi:hypothetical protein